MKELAVIRTGGKQYVVAPGAKIKVEKLAGESGQVLFFDDVLLVGDKTGREVEIGTPRVSSARVEARILRQGRARKVIVFKYKPKKRYRVKRGHRQHFTEVEITKIQSA